MRYLTTAVVAAALTACGAAEPERLLTAGEWTVDVEVPEVVRPMALLIRVPDANEGWELVGLPAHGFIDARLDGISVTDTAVHFTWPMSRSRACRLVPQPDGSYTGECVADGDAPWRMRMEPPSRRSAPVGTARRALESADVAWQTLDQGAVRVHGIEGVDLQDVATRAAASIAASLQLLDAGGYDRPIDVFVVDTRAQLTAITGMEVNGFADPLGSAVVLTGFARQQTPLKHELMHVLSVQKWGAPANPFPWVMEGLATYTAGACAGRTVHELTSYMREAGTLLEVEKLLDHFYSNDDLVTYIESASFFGYLMETHGAAVARAVWTQGLAAGLRASRLDAAAEEQAWLRGLPAPATAADWQSIVENGCG